MFGKKSSQHGSIQVPKYKVRAESILDIEKTQSTDYDRIHIYFI